MPVVAHGFASIVFSPPLLVAERKHRARKRTARLTTPVPLSGRPCAAHQRQSINAGTSWATMITGHHGPTPPLDSSVCDAKMQCAPRRRRWHQPWHTASMMVTDRPKSPNCRVARCGRVTQSSFQPARRKLQSGIGSGAWTWLKNRSRGDTCVANSSKL